MTLIPSESPIIHHRKRRLIPSATIELAQKARLLRAQGQDVIEIAGGDPDFHPDAHVSNAITEALNRGETKYTHPRGIPQLRNAIAQKLLRENRIKADPESQIIVTAGGKEAIAITLMALLENGEEVLIPAPSWVSFDNMTLLAGGVPRTVAGSPFNNFKITPHDLDKNTTVKTRALIFNNPHNPTGQIYTKKEVTEIAEWCSSMGVYLISDEVYEHIVFDDNKLFSPASEEKFSRFTITVNACSKSYCMTGLRLGWLHTSKWLVDKIDPVHQHLITCAPSIIQWGAIAALEGSQDGVRNRQKTYSSRRDLVVKLLSSSKTVKPLKPEGTFYLFIDISGSELSSGEFCATLLENTGVALCPGSAFGSAGEGWVRMLFAREEEVLKEACNRIIKLFG